jgi:hypothetical protein
MEFGEHIGGLLAALVSLRIFEIEADGPCPMGDALAFFTKASDRAPHLKYFAMLHSRFRFRYYWKQIGGEWVICDEMEFPLDT